MVDTEERGDCTGREKGREWKGREGKNVRNRGMGRNGKDEERKVRSGEGLEEGASRKRGKRIIRIRRGGRGS